MKTRLLAACVLAGLLVAATAHAAVITPLNRDPAGSGLNDPTAAAPVGGNPGNTIGEQRRIAYQFAADLWGAVLQSNVEIRVAASFQPSLRRTHARINRIGRSVVVPAASLPMCRWGLQTGCRRSPAGRRCGAPAGSSSADCR